MRYRLLPSFPAESWLLNRGVRDGGPAAVHHCPASRINLSERLCTQIHDG
jgi:hypothetical protein